MSSFPIKPFAIPSILSEIADPPKQLHIRGTTPPEEYTYLAIVGSRKYTPYGKQMCEYIIHGLRGYPVVIVSGLALGIDAIAHRAALSAGLCTVAVPGSGLADSVLYPRTNMRLAHDILTANGALISEFPADWKPRRESFPQRNRIMAGLCHAVLVVEAEERSGTLITSRLATEYNRDVLAVPGSAQSVTSKGPHMLIQKGAALVTSGDDVRSALSIPDKEASTSTPTKALSKNEALVKELLRTPCTRDELIARLELPTTEVNVLLSSLELQGQITESLGKISWVE